MNSRLVIHALLLCVVASVAALGPFGTARGAQAALTAEDRAADFDQMWSFVDARYCYFDEKATDWGAVRDRYRPLAFAAADRHAFIAVLEAALDELYDPHTHLGVNLASSWRLPPHDMWVEWRAGRAVVAEVRRGSAAARSGMAAGMAILEVGGEPVASAVAARRPMLLRRPDPEADAWALRSVVAGRHDTAREYLVVDRDGRRRRIRVDETAGGASSEPSVSSRRLSSDVGYIRIASLGDPAAVDAFDRALESLRATRALVLDVRDNPGGDTAIARPIMGRLVDRKLQYASMARREGRALGAKWSEYVEPRGPWTYRGRVLVLVNHFSESMAEGFAMGLDGMRRATVVGTTMAGLGAAISRIRLERSGYDVQISAEPVYHVGGAPRTRFKPHVVVDLAREAGEDAILAAALRRL
jgi:carboxyl-terminal processing protease